MVIDYTAIGHRIRAQRKFLKITQESLAEQVDISNPHLSNIERGVTKVSLPTLVLIANALNKTIDYFLCESMPQAKTIYGKELRDILDGCDEKELRIMTETLRTLKVSLQSVYKPSDEIKLCRRE